TMLIGTAQFAVAVAWLKRPTTGLLVALGLLVGAGLLTKGTFLLTGPALTIVVARRQPRASVITAFCLIWLITGCYKYVENTVYLGRPIVHNQDIQDAIAQSQRGTWKGWQTLIDVNVIKLIRRPILQINNTFSYPLLMYGTFWYPHIP